MTRGPADPEPPAPPAGRGLNESDATSLAPALRPATSRPGPEGFRFELLARDGAARAGRFSTPRGDVETPAFMPVGTQAAVKALDAAELHELRVPMILANAYHLYLRPGAGVVAEAGGLHRFMNWSGPILTDSGGYQVFSLAGMMRVDDEGVTFRSHLDGSPHRFTPELALDVQRALGSDVAMPLDHCLANPAGRGEARAAMDRTLGWLERSVRHAEARAREAADGTAAASVAGWPAADLTGAPAASRDDGGPVFASVSGGMPQALFGIVQGSTYADLRRESARATRAFELPGMAVGGLAVGETNRAMCEVLEATEPELDPARPRYLMGVGFPEDLVQAVARGMDLFDCVAPTRHGRNGTLFTRAGRINLRNTAFRRDHGPPDPECGCRACATASRAYLSHLFHAREILGLRLATYHNVAFLTDLLRAARQAVVEGRFAGWSAAFLERYAHPAGPRA